jgi:hypothetical protein
MAESYFVPRIGRKYDATRIMILSESAYSWLKDGKVIDPGPSHPTENLNCWGIERFGKRVYYTPIGQALCGKKFPSHDELEQAWDEYAYTIFVQRTVGLGRKSRPTKKQWDEAEPCLISLIEKMNPRPLKIIVTGKTMWNHHMNCTGPHLCHDVQAYRLSDGTLVWCLALPHTANRETGVGFQWEWVGKYIRTFRSFDFPLREA